MMLALSVAVCFLFSLQAGVDGAAARVLLLEALNAPVKTSDREGTLGTRLEALESQMDDQLRSVGDSARCTETLQDKPEPLQEKLDGPIQQTVRQLEQSQDSMPTSCVDVKRYDPVNGVHTLNVYGRNVTVFCDQVADEGGWAVIQRRRDGSVDFSQIWSAYEAGFGNLSVEFWLGLEKIHWLTASKKQTLRVELTDFAGNSAFAKYDSFVIGGPDSFYRLNVSGYSGNAGDSMNYSSHCPFSTKDLDNDVNPGICAPDHAGGWWYKSCTYANPNGVYSTTKKTDTWKYVVWFHWKKGWDSLKYAEMKIRPR